MYSVGAGAEHRKTLWQIGTMTCHGFIHLVNAEYVLQQLLLNWHLLVQSQQ